MSERTEFIKLWKDTEDAVVYCVKSRMSEDKFITQDKLNEIIENEVINKRWFSTTLSTESLRWLNEFCRQYPAAGEKVKLYIMDMHMEAGINTAKIGIKSVASAGAGVISSLIFKSSMLGVIVSAIGVVWSLTDFITYKEQVDQEIKSQFARVSNLIETTIDEASDEYCISNGG